MRDITRMLDAMQQAVTLCERVRTEGVDASSKTDDSPVTIADYGAQALLCRAIASHYPGDAVIGEEGGAAFRELVSPAAQAHVAALIGDIIGEQPTVEQVIAWLDYGREADPSGYTWLIDPIDGTVGFVDGRYYAVCLGLMQAYDPVQAAIGLPRSPIDAGGSIVYTGGDGVRVLPLAGGESRPVGRSARGGDAVLFLDSVKLPPDEMALAGEIRAAAGFANNRVELYDSQLKYAMIAAGYGDAFVRMPRDIAQEPHKIWDHAPGAALVRASGGRITAVDGAALDFSQGDDLPHLGFVASNGHIHDDLLRGVQQITGAAWGF